MHHIRHIRKNPYKGLQGKAFLKIMSLRNRKQIPVCRRCHIHVIHAGKYSGSRLSSLLYENTLFYNRVVHTESFINSSNKEYFAKSMEEKNFKRKNETGPNSKKGQ